MTTPTTLAPAAPSTPEPMPRPSSPLRGVFRGSVGQLRLVGALCILASLVFGLLGAAAFRERGLALADARDDTAQLVRVQTIQTSLVQADAEATNAFLVGGLAPPTQRAIYDEAISSVGRLISEAAGAQPADAETLGEVNAALTDYSDRISLARANNRQGFPVGSAYLRQASVVLRQQILPDLQDLTEANRVRTSQAFAAAGSAGTRMAVAIIVGLVVLLGGSLWLALRTHRAINVPLAVAVVSVLVVLVFGGLLMSIAQAKARDVRATSYTATYALARASVLAYDAKSQESLGLIARGNAAAAEAIRMTDTEQAQMWYEVGRDAGADTDAAAQLSAWADVHGQVRDLDDAGDWDAAVALATTVDSDGSNAAFDRFTQSSAQALDGQATAAADGLAFAHTALVWAGWVTLLLGIVAAVASWLGISQRLAEYR